MLFYYGGSEIPGHRKLLAEQGVTHTAMSYMGLRRRTKFSKPWMLEEHYTPDTSVMVDSGCHTLNRAGVDVDKEEIQGIAAHYLQFIEDNIARIQAYTEFDALAMGPEWIEHRRQYLHLDKAIIVWHEDWGVDTLKQMADRYPYIAVGQTTSQDRDIVPVLRTLAREKRLHGMGFSSPPVMLAADWYSVSSTTWLSASQHGETFVWTGKEMKRYPARYKTQARKRHRTLFEGAGLDAALIEADDPSENLKLSLWSWRQQVDHISQRHGVTVTPTPKTPETRNGETPPSTVAGTPQDPRTETATHVSAERVKRILPGIETEDFTHRYTDPDTGERTSRTEIRLHAVDPAIRKCDNCFLSAKCPEYDPGSSCVYEIPVRVRTKEQYMSLLDGIISMQAMRVFSMRMFEEVEGGYVDPNLSQEMDRLARFVKLKSDIEEAGFTFSMKMQSKDGAQVGLLSRLFGEKTSGGPPALSPAGTVSIEHALGQMGVAQDILDVEVVE